jgi:hypothetical protein
MPFSIDKAIQICCSELPMADKEHDYREGLSDILGDLEYLTNKYRRKYNLRDGDGTGKRETDGGTGKRETRDGTGKKETRDGTGKREKY